MNRGFTLVEVLVALLVLELGLLGGLSLLTTASRTLSRAVTLELAVAALEGAADSLLDSGWSGAGRSGLGAGEVTWTSTSDSVVSLSFEPTGNGRDRVRIRLTLDVAP